ncbi:pilus assembly protein TadG-related protein [Actimicrobium antarcticum]|uniref:Putative Flp pilus-assembly TadG-like N-terminal domain-containing protein n=1 Tax=Actimicrobium antarcticum TaxID=1051899 RepID=A0ABP7TQY7_9BURK
MYRGSQHQRGQALIYGIFVLIGGLTALHFLFNTGQLSSEKTKLVNTADAVAYSAGVMQARALNFDAYNNRALVANEVLVAQMVSLSSWGQYVTTHSNKLLLVLPSCLNIDTAVVSAFVDFDLIYGSFCLLAANFAINVLSDAGAAVTNAAAGMIPLIEASKTAIRTAQTLLHAPVYFQAASLRVMQDVADRNYAGDGAVTVASLGPTSSGNPSSSLDLLNGFTRRYADADRTRFAEVARIAASSDSFVRQRNWTSNAVVPQFCLDSLRTNSVRRRGGTELIGLDEWKAEDTESFWAWRKSRGFLGFLSCDQRETPIGVGMQQAYPDGMDQDESGAWLGGSRSTNPAASGSATSTAWNGYTGLPSFYDLSDLTAADPVMKFSVRLTRNAASTRTSDGSSAITATPRLNNFSNNFANGVMTATASGEVFFERPLTDPGNVAGGNFNQYAEAVLGSVSRREIGSLFNPYWQVRLALAAP